MIDEIDEIVDTIKSEIIILTKESRFVEADALMQTIFKLYKITERKKENE